MPIFRKCKDPALTALKDVGFNVVQLPRPDIMPTQLLVGSGSRLRRLGELTSVFVPDDDSAPPPGLRPNQPGPNISGTSSNDIKIGLGIDILSGLISALGGGTLGINAAYSKAGSVQFTYSDISLVDADFSEIDAYIASSQINPHARAVKRMLEADDVFVVTSVVKSRKLEVSSKSKDGSEFKVDVPVIENTIGANVSLATAGENTSLISYQGAIPLTFGFQAMRLEFKDGVYRAAKRVKTGTVVAEGVEAIPEEATEPAYLDSHIMLEAEL